MTQTTPKLGLPMPDPAGVLEEDVLLLRQTLLSLDTHVSTINGLLASDDVNLDTMRELVAAIKANRTDLDAVLVDKASAAALTAETAARQQADTDEATARAAADAVLDARLTAEVAGLQATIQGGEAALTLAAGVVGTLTAASKRVQSVTATGIGAAIKLPDATALPGAGGPVFVLANQGQYTFAIRDYAGGFVGAVEPGATALLWISDRSTAAGAWLAIDASESFASAAASLPGGASGWEMVAVVALTPSRAVACFVDNTNSSYGTAVVLDVTGKTVTPGGRYVFRSEMTYEINAVALDASTVLVTMRAGGNGKAQVLKVSDTSITVGTVMVFKMDAGTGFALDKLDSSRAVVVWGQSGYGTQACVLSVSGTTVTAGAVVTFAGAFGNNAVVGLSDTLALVAGDTGSGSDVTCSYLIISGTTITTAGGTTVVTSINIPRSTLALEAVDANNALLFVNTALYNGAGQRVLEVYPITISPFTVGAPSRSPALTYVGGLYFSIGKLTADRYAAWVVDSTTYDMTVLPMDRHGDGRLRFGAPSTPLQVTSAYTSVALLSGGDFIALHDKLKARVFEVKP